ncbi:MAG: DUF2087 domain-containing protein [Brevirhabdus sp.]
MAQSQTPLYIDDLSAFSKTLRRSLSEAGEIPGHLAFLNLVAKAAGHRNLQTLKATQPGLRPDMAKVEKAARAFDAQGRLARWPAQTKVQGLCMWAIWHQLPPRQDLSEPEVNAVLKSANSFGDHVLLRRSLIDHKLASRDTDGRHYRRIEQRPPDEARALIRQVLSHR